MNPYKCPSSKLYPSFIHNFHFPFGYLPLKLENGSSGLKGLTTPSCENE